MVLEPTSAFVTVVNAAAKKIVSELQDLEVSPYTIDQPYIIWACRCHGLLHYLTFLRVCTGSTAI
jgi:hypothetical protein